MRHGGPPGEVASGAYQPRGHRPVVGECDHRPASGRTPVTDLLVTEENGNLDA